MGMAWVAAKPASQWLAQRHRSSTVDHFVAQAARRGKDAVGTRCAPPDGVARVRFAYVGGIRGTSFSSSSTPVITSFRRPSGRA